MAQKDIQSNFTFCTFFFDIGHKNRSDMKGGHYHIEKYINSINLLAKRCQPMYIWCDDLMYQKINYLNENDNIIIIKKNIKDLFMYQYKDKFLECLKNMDSIRNKSKFSHMFKYHNNLEAIMLYLVVTNSKMEILKEAIKVNPFKSEIFTWIDFGIFQHSNIVAEYQKLNTWLPYETKTFRATLWENKKLETLQSYKNEDLVMIYGDRPIEILATVFTFNKNFFEFLYQKYIKTFNSLIESNLITTEQLIMVILIKSFQTYDSEIISTLDLQKGNYNQILDNLIKKNN